MRNSQYRQRLEADLKRWVEKGWVSGDAATEIRADVAESSAHKMRLPALLGGVGAICLALAVIAFIAANWAAIPRPVKLGGVALLLVSSHGLAAWAAQRGFKIVADLTTVFACMIFVAGLALVGQMYHLPTDWAGGALLVVFGSLAAAWGTGSRGALLIFVPAVVVWMGWRADGFALSPLSIVLAVAFLGAALAHAIRFPGLASRWAVMAQGVATYVWLVLGAMEARTIVADEEVVFYALTALVIFAAAVSVLGYALSHAHPVADRVPESAQLLAGTGVYVGALGLAGGVFAALLVTFATDTYSVYIQEILTLWPIAGVLAIAIAATGLLLSTPHQRAPAASVSIAAALGVLMPVVMALMPGVVTVHAVLALAAMIAISVAGSHASLLSWTIIGNLGIAAVLLFLLQVTVGSLIGQSLFFLLAGVVLIGVALLSARLLKRRGRRAEEATS